MYAVAALMRWALESPAGQRRGARHRTNPLEQFERDGYCFPGQLHSEAELDQSDMGKPRHKRGDGYVGKMQGSGNKQFTMFDDGINPTVDGVGPNTMIRRELAVIAYPAKSSSGGRTQTQDRRMECAIPAIIARPDGQENSVVWRPRTKGTAGVWYTMR